MINHTHRETVLTTATCNSRAVTAVGVSLSTFLAVVVGSAPLRARHGVPLQRPVAYVLRGRQDAPAALRPHVELILLRKALPYVAPAATASARPPHRRRVQPAQLVVPARLGGDHEGGQSCGDQQQPNG